MTLDDRQGYQQAVQCLMEKPARHKGLDGVRTAWDDYGALHYYQTPYVHNSATFLLWHRHYNWVLEQDLRDLCGYNGESLVFGIASPAKLGQGWEQSS
jgi:tyrosinase